MVQTHSESVDYPDHAHAVAEDVAGEHAELGILICGSANGVAMTANKHSDVRACIAWTPEVASLGRQHNNANVCAFLRVSFLRKRLWRWWMRFSLLNLKEDVMHVAWEKLRVPWWPCSPLS